VASRRIAFVMTGGGSLGAVQVGMATALLQRGIEPDVLVGTSVGAVNAAYLAGPGTTGDRLASLAALWSGMHRRDLFSLQPRRWVRATLGTAPSMFSGDPLRLLLERHLSYHAFEDARLPLHVTATDVITGAGVILSSGPVLDAVRASAAVPGLLPPVDIGGRTLVDGAIGHPGALAHADDCDVDEIYLLPAGYPCAGTPPRTALSTLLTAVSVLLHRQLVDEVRAYNGHARLHVVPPLCPLAISPADFTHVDSLMHRARAETDGWLSHRSDDDPPGTDDGVLAFHGPHDEPRQPPHPPPAAPGLRKGTRS
jgi:NTE family protein